MIAPEIKLYAKKLYLEPNEEGGHKHSLQQIADNCNKKFNTKIDKSTIHLWAKKWTAIYEKAITSGLVEAVKKDVKFNEKINTKNIIDNVEIDELATNVISKANIDRQSYNMRINKLASNIIEKHLIALNQVIEDNPSEPLEAHVVKIVNEINKTALEDTKANENKILGNVPIRLVIEKEAD